MSARAPRVTVVGSVNLDVVTAVARPPAVGETIRGRSLQYLPGGKGANQAVAAARLGARVSMVGKVGDDGAADLLLDFLRREHVDISHVTRADGPSGTALVVVAHDGENHVIVVGGANDQLTPSDVHGVTIAERDILVSQLEVPIPTIDAAFRRARAAGATTVLNPAPAGPIPRALLELADVVILNETELATLLDRWVAPEDAGAAAQALRASIRQTVIVTLGAAGAVAAHDGEVLEVPGRAVEPVDSTGAGDCFVGALAARLASGAAVDDALVYANAAASRCVQRAGAGPSMPWASEVEALLESPG
jgi:ribokinase